MNLFRNNVPAQVNCVGRDEPIGLSALLRCALAFVMLLVSWTSVVAQNSEAESGRPSAVMDSVSVSMVTFYPGSIIYELEGHSALRLTGPDFDVAISYGMFDFDKPGFVYRFVKGETDYSVGDMPWGVFEESYVKAGRRIVEQKLNMDNSQKERLFQLIQENLRPENRVYRYNYVLDNCATRPLRIVERALGDSIYLAEPVSSIPAKGKVSFRQIMRKYHANYPWYQFGIDLALGSGIDAPLDVREMSFAPAVLVEQMAAARIGGPDGPALVVETRVLNDVPADNAVESATPWYATPMFVCWLLFILAGVYAVWSVVRRNEYPRILAATMFVVNALVGCLLAFLIFVSVHEATSPNWNFLWLNPLAFIPAVTIWFSRWQYITIWYNRVNIVLLVILILVWIFGVQCANPAFVPLVLLDALVSVSYEYYVRCNAHKLLKE